MLNQCQAAAGARLAAPGRDRCGAAALLLINLCKITTVSGKRSTTSRTFRARSSGEGCSALTLQSWGLQTALSWGHLTSHCSTAALVSDAADGWSEAQNDILRMHSYNIISTNWYFPRLACWPLTSADDRCKVRAIRKCGKDGRLQRDYGCELVCVKC